MVLSEQTQQLVEQWMRWDKNDETRAEIQALVDQEAEDELRRRLQKRIKFGTAGLRGRMTAGFAFMNDLTVTQASQGLVKSVMAVFEQKKAEEGVQRAVCIGHDARHHSATFARLTASAFLASGVPVYFFREIVPTPMVVCIEFFTTCWAHLLRFFW